MNSKMTTSPSEPTYTNNVNSLCTPVVTGSQAQNACANGNYYVVTTGTLTIAVGGFMGLQIVNPANSGVNLNVNRLSGGSLTKTSLIALMSATFTADASLTVVSINNSNTNYSVKKSAMTGKYSVMASNPASSGTPLFNLVSGSSGGMIDYLYSGSVIFGPGSALFACIQNIDVQISTVSLNIGWWEK